MSQQLNHHETVLTQLLMAVGHTLWSWCALSALIMQSATCFIAMLTTRGIRTELLLHVCNVLHNYW